MPVIDSALGVGAATAPRYQEPAASTSRRRIKALKQSARAPEDHPVKPASTGPPPLLVSISEAARIMARSPSIVYALIGTGELEAKRDGRRTLVVYQSIVKRVQALPVRTPGVQAPGLKGHEHDGRKRRKAR